MGLIPRKYYLGDDFFEDFFEPALKDQMKCDIYEKDDKYNIVIDIPGFDKDDINVDFDKGYITISAETKSEENEDNKKYIRRERHYGKFTRSFYVGDIDSDSIDAKFNKGTLKVTIPKASENNTKKAIEIK
jgi:HSP20 family protein